MDKDCILKTKSILKDLIDCLSSTNRNGFYEINSNIYSIMFDGPTLKPIFSMILPNKLSGYFANIMWNISQTGAYFSDIIGGYRVTDILECVCQINEFLDKEMFKTIAVDESDFLTNLLTACSLMQTNIANHDRKDYKGQKITVSEDIRNYYLRDLFDFKGLYVRGQEHQGASLKGVGSGEVDILICKTDIQPKIYIEGMNLNSVNSTLIDSHYEKLFLYDSSINKSNYLLSYVSVLDFNSFCTNYKKHFLDYAGKSRCECVNDVPSDYANIKVFVSKSIHEGNEINTYHVLILFEEY